MNTLYGNQQRWKVLGALGLVYFIWGSTYLGIALAIQSMPPILMLGTRFGIAGLMVYAWLFFRGRGKLTLMQLWNATIAGSLLLGVGTGTLAIAEQYIPSGLAAVIVTVSPVWMVTLDWLWKGGPRPNAFTIVGIVLGILGIAVLFDPMNALGGSSVNLPAALALVAGSLAWAIGSLFGRHADLPRDPFLSTAVQMGMGGLVLTVVGIGTGELGLVDVASVTAASFGAWAYLIVFGSIVAFTAYVWLMRNTSPTLVSTHAFVNPVVAVLLGWAFLNETLTSSLFLATALLVAGLLFISRAGQRRGPGSREPEPGTEALTPTELAGAPGQPRGVGLVRRNPVARLRMFGARTAA